MKIDLSSILSSQARFKILETLYGFNDPIPLRHLEALTGLAIRSVQVAVEGLVQEKILIKKKIGRNVLYGLNLQSSASFLICKLFNLIKKDQIQSRAVDYGKKAQNALMFSNEMIELLLQTKKT